MKPPTVTDIVEGIEREVLDEVAADQKELEAQRLDPGPPPAHRVPAIVTQALVRRNPSTGRYLTEFKGERADPDETEESLEAAGRVTIRQAQRYRKLIGLEMLRRRTLSIQVGEIEAIVLELRQMDLQGLIPAGHLGR